VMIANEPGMRAAAEHLIELGHKRIAYLGDRNGYQSDTERFAGYRAALEGAKFEVKNLSSVRFRDERTP